MKEAPPFCTSRVDGKASTAEIPGKPPLGEHLGLSRCSLDAMPVKSKVLRCRCKIRATSRLGHLLNDWAGLTNGSWTTFGPIQGPSSIDKALKMERWARRAVLSTLYPLIVRSCVAGACTYLQQILSEDVLQIVVEPLPVDS
jgi:hypothetical protein